MVFGKIPGSCKRTEKGMEYEGDSDTNCYWFIWNNAKRNRKESGSKGDPRKNQDNSDNSTVKINVDDLQKNLLKIKSRIKDKILPLEKRPGKETGRTGYQKKN